MEAANRFSQQSADFQSVLDAYQQALAAESYKMQRNAADEKARIENEAAVRASQVAAQAQADNANASANADLLSQYGQLISNYTGGTDTAAALRASEINAEAMLMAKNGVDGVYTDDPKTNPNAKKLDKITYDDIIVNGLKVMDTSACALCKQNNIPIIVFDFDAKDAITGILNGKEIGTYIN